MRTGLAGMLATLAACSDPQAASPAFHRDAAAGTGGDAGGGTGGEPSAGTGGEAGTSVVFPGATWDPRAPADLGLDEGRLQDFRAATGDVRGVIVRDGYLAYAWGDVAERIDWYSAAKPVISTLLLFAVSEGKLSSVDSLVGDRGWTMAAKDASMTFRHLADMVSGYARAEPPGTAWAYNDLAIQLYAVTLFDRVYAEGSPDDAAQHADRLGALGIEDGRIFGSRGGYGLDMSTRDFARVGWLWLNRGRWDDRQLIPGGLFDAEVKPDVPAGLPRTQAEGSDYLGVGSYGGGSDQTPHGPGFYGMNSWFNPGGATWPSVPHDAYQANGLWNRFALTVIPSLGIVAAWEGTTASADDFAGPMDDALSVLVDAVAGR